MKLEFGPEDFEESLREQVEMYMKNTIISMHIYLLIYLGTKKTITKI